MFFNFPSMSVKHRVLTKDSSLHLPQRKSPVL